MDLGLPTKLNEDRICWITLCGPSRLDLRESEETILLSGYRDGEGDINVAQFQSSAILPFRG